jgi:hypothetical protein
VPADVEIPERMGVAFLPGEQILTAWRALDVSPDRPYPERPYIYLYATAIPLDAHPDVTSAADLAAKELDLIHGQASLLEVISSTSGMAGDVPIYVVDYRQSHRVTDDSDPHQPASVEDIAADFSGGGESETSQLEVRARDVFFVQGDWGYQLHLVATQPKALSDRFDELDAVLRSLRLASTTPAATVPPAPAAPATAPGAATLDHRPVAGTDFTLAFPSGRNWSNVGPVRGLEGVARLDTLQGEALAGTWRRPSSPNGGPYSYLFITAVDLANHPDVETAQDLADTKLELFCRYSDGCDVQHVASPTIGGQPGAVYESRETRRWEDTTVSLDDTAVEDNDAAPVSEVTWYSQHAFVVRGNWGYEVRLTSIDPAVTEGHTVDFEHVVNSLQFMY